MQFSLLTFTPLFVTFYKIPVEDAYEGVFKFRISMRMAMLTKGEKDCPIVVWGTLYNSEYSVHPEKIRSLAIQKSKIS